MSLVLKIFGIGKIKIIPKIINSNKKQLIKIIDILGREIKRENNTVLFHIYNDGSVERKMIIK